MKLAVVLFNLGGPDSPEAVEPFLRNLFSDPAIIALPAIIRLPLARLIARRRAHVARKIYDHIGGRSPIFEETRRQADALESALSRDGVEAKAFVAMRCWHPFSDGAARAVKAFVPDKIVLLPLYPQYSTTTSASSLKDWARAAKRARLDAPTARVCCYPCEPGFVAAMAARIADAARNLEPDRHYRLLLSAHGLPRRTIAKGDPYQWQVEQSAAAITRALNRPELEAVVCYQSRDGKGVIVAPIAFVSEHSETLVELDIEYRKLAAETGVRDYRRAGTAGTHGDFVAGLAGLVRAALDGKTVACGQGACGNNRICPPGHKRCGYK
jgi:protoporphyrin/coproporphyrin ferrochelatase